METYYVYLLISEKDNSWYIGYTSNLKERIMQHNSGKTISTKRKLPWRILYYEVSFNIEDAIAREKYFKM